MEQILSFIVNVLAVPVLVFALVILIHEAGHLLFAKLAGVEVTDFALGFGPSLYSREWHGTRYHICAYPLGGYVRVSGMDPDDPITKNSYQSTRTWWKLLILAGGSMGNFVLGVVLIFVLAFIGFPKQIVVVQELVVGGPAAEAGIQPGDIVESANGKRIYDNYAFTSIINDASVAGQPVAITLERRGILINRSVTPRIFNVKQEGMNAPYNGGKPSLGMLNYQTVMVTRLADLVTPNQMAADAGMRPGDTVVSVGGEEVKFGMDVYYLIGQDAKGLKKPTPIIVEREGKRIQLTLPVGTNFDNLGVLFHMELEKLPIGATVVRAVRSVYVTTAVFITSLLRLATKEGAEMVSGPLGIVNIISQASRTGIYNLIQIAMIITLNLGLMNLLPIPALDGGHIFFVLLNAIGIHISPKREAMAHKVGFALLISLILLITFRDAFGWLKMSG